MPKIKWHSQAPFISQIQEWGQTSVEILLELKLLYFISTPTVTGEMSLRQASCLSEDQFILLCPILQEVQKYK